MRLDKSFVALYAEYTQGMIRSVAMVEVVNAVVVGEFHSFVKPATNKSRVLDALLSVFSGRKYADAPEFPEVLHMMEEFAGRSTIVIYDEKEQLGQLYKVCKAFGLQDCDFWKHEILDIYHLPGERLKDSCEYNGIKLKAGSSTLDKARACAKLFMQVGKMHTVSSNEWYNGSKYLSTWNRDLFDLLPDEEIENRNTIFYHKRIFTMGLFSRYPDINVLLCELQKFGAVNRPSFSSSVQMAIIGEGADPVILKKIRRIDNNVQILSDFALYDIMDSIKRQKS